MLVARLCLDAFEGLERDGVLLSTGWASREANVIDFERARMPGGHGRIEPFTASAPFGPVEPGSIWGWPMLSMRDGVPVA
ncbi:hypothetical protein [Actinomadura napierensis]|uniref:Uncharacterized protein n=1 Tax=Actinomadura napierensis TaxID=267854 RepID=A0ABP5M4U0_9ACTN